MPLWWEREILVECMIFVYIIWFDINIHYWIIFQQPLDTKFHLDCWLQIGCLEEHVHPHSSDRPDLWCVKDPRWDENGVMVSLQDGPSLPARGGQRAAQGLVDHALSYNNTVNDYMETLWLTMTLRRTTVQSIFQFKRVGECHTFPLSPYKWKREVDVSLSSPVVFAFQRFAVYTRIWI